MPVKSVAMIDTYASSAWVSASIPEALVRPFGCVIMKSVSIIAIFGSSS